MKISIVTPSYNQAQFIEHTMQSVLAQTGEFELEYIVVDGQSTDGSVDIIQRIAQRDTRVRWLSEPDQGQSNAINKGLHMATGEVVAWLNSDDIYYPGTLQRIATLFQNNTVHWAAGCCRIINEQDQEVHRLITRYKNTWLTHYSYTTLLILNYISQPATFWRRRLLDTVGYLDETEHLVMDYDLWCRFGQKFSVVVMPHYLAGFRIYTSSKSGQRFVKQFVDEYRVAKKYTHQRFILGLHKLHTTLITSVYKLIR